VLRINLDGVVSLGNYVKDVKHGIWISYIRTNNKDKYEIQNFKNGTFNSSRVGEKKDWDKLYENLFETSWRESVKNAAKGNAPDLSKFYSKGMKERLQKGLITSLANIPSL
jgi:hypothetical protein